MTRFKFVENIRTTRKPRKKHTKSVQKLRKIKNKFGDNKELENASLDKYETWHKSRAVYQRHSDALYATYGIWDNQNVLKHTDRRIPQTN